MLATGGIGEIDSFILWNKNKDGTNIHRFKYYLKKGTIYFIIGLIFFVVGIILLNKE